MNKLVLINQQYLPETASTGQIFHAIAKYLVFKGWQVEVATGKPYYPGLEKKQVPKNETMDGVSIHRLWCTTFPKNSFRGKLMNLGTFILSLFFYCLRIPHDRTVMVTTAPPLGVCCAYLGKKIRKYRLVMTVQDLYPDALAAAGMSNPNSFAYRFLEKLVRISMCGCDAVQTISYDIQQHLQNHYGLKNVEIIPNLSPREIIPMDGRTAKHDRGWEDKLVVQYSGNFGVAHEYKTLFDAACLLKSKSDILFQIAGSGYSYDKMQRACREAQLSNVIFEGYAPISELEKHLARADVSVVVFDSAFKKVLLPSKYYGILASGRPILLISGCESDISRDIEENNCGKVFQHGESDKLAKQLSKWLSSPQELEEMGENSRKLYEEQYTQEIILPKIEEFLIKASKVSAKSGSLNN